MTRLKASRSWEVLSSDDGLNRCLVVAKRFHEKQKRTAAIEEAKPRRTFRKSSTRRREGNLYGQMLPDAATRERIAGRPTRLHSQRIAIGH